MEERCVERAGRAWEQGTPATVRWIQDGFRTGVTIASSVPPVFDAYATVVDPWSGHGDPLYSFDRGLAEQAVRDGAWLEPEHAAARDTSAGWRVQERLVEALSAYGSSSWWLGYLDTGASDVVFPDASSVELYVRWPYKLVRAGPGEALGWRVFLPDLVFPVDHAWCLSTGWDDTWTSIGGPAQLIEELALDPVVRARVVGVDEESTPPGHVAV